LIPVGPEEELLAGARGGTLEHAEDVGLMHDEELLAVDLHLAAGILAEQNLIAHLDVEGDALATFIALAFADGDDLATLGLLLGRVGNDDTANRLLIGFLVALHEDAVVKGTHRHVANLQRVYVNCLANTDATAVPVPDVLLNAVKSVVAWRLEGVLDLGVGHNDTQTQVTR
jgi:hypothetical protein